VGPHRATPRRPRPRGRPHRRASTRSFEPQHPLEDPGKCGPRRPIWSRARSAPAGGRDRRSAAVELRLGARAPHFLRRGVPRRSLEVRSSLLAARRISDRPSDGGGPSPAPFPAVLSRGPRGRSDRGDSAISRVRWGGRAGGGRRSGVGRSERGDFVARPTRHLGADRLSTRGARERPPFGRRGVGPSCVPPPPRAVPLPRPADATHPRLAPHSVPHPLRVEGHRPGFTAASPKGSDLGDGRPLAPVPHQSRNRRPLGGPVRRRPSRVRLGESFGSGTHGTPRPTGWTCPPRIRGRARGGAHRDRLRTDQDAPAGRSGSGSGRSGGSLGESGLGPGHEVGGAPRAPIDSPMDARYGAALSGLWPAHEVARHVAGLSMPGVCTSFPPRDSGAIPTGRRDPDRRVPPHPVRASPPRSTRSRTVSGHPVVTESFCADRRYQ